MHSSDLPFIISFIIIHRSLCSNATPFCWPYSRSFAQNHFDGFFTPRPRSYTTSLLDGVARNYFSYFFYLPGYARSTQFIVFGSIYSYLLCPRREEKTTWSELESNPGPRASIIHKRLLWPLDHASTTTLFISFSLILNTFCAEPTFSKVLSSFALSAFVLPVKGLSSHSIPFPS